MIDEKRLAEIEARISFASSAPWTSGPVSFLSAPDGIVCDIHLDDDGNREFIMHAREDVPALVAEVRRQRAVLTRMGDIVSKMADLEPNCVACAALVEAVKDSTEAQK